MEVSSPAVVKILGEHAVVYGKLAVAAAISFYAKAEVTNNGANILTIKLIDLDKESNFTSGQLDDLYVKYKRKSNIQQYITDSETDFDMLAYATIASRIAKEFAIDLRGKIVSLHSEIPIGKGYASSAACCTAFAVALLNEARNSLDDSVIIDVARDGERVFHKNENAGSIDVSTTYFGGIVSYSKANGPKKESMENSIDIVLINTGPKKTTAETVGHVAEFYKENKAYADAILDKINKCSIDGLECLKKGDMQKLGALMFEDQYLLRELGVSSDSLDKAVELGRENDAYGVKLSGGGGGGIAIAISKNPNALIEVMNKAGFESRIVPVSTKGAIDYYKMD